MNECVACGRPAEQDFCVRPDCLTYGSGACAPGPSIVAQRVATGRCVECGTGVRVAVMWNGLTEAHEPVCERCHHNATA